MRDRLRILLASLFLLTVSLPVLVFSQQVPNGGTHGAASDSSSRMSPARTGATEQPASPHETANGIEQDYSEALSLVEEDYVDGAKIDYGNVFKSSIIGMLRSLDPHSNYYDRKEFEELRNEWRSEYFGIGASIGDRKVGDQVDTYILATFPESPAARAGLRFGDRIVEVDAQSMRGRPSADVRDRIRGQKGTIVKLTVESAATGKREMVELTRDAVAQPSISDSYLIKPGIGYIAMNGGFNYTTADEFNSAVDDLHGKGMNQLILDLRNNPGGLLDQAKRVAERFLPRGEVILSQKGRMPNSDHVYRSETRTPDDEPLVLLVNRGTASASEIFAGAMQDHDRAILIGETTFGKGLVQSIIPLEYGSALTLTSSKYLLPSGRLIQRDYSNGNLYDYYLRGINRQDDESKKSQSAPVEQPTGAESHTDTGRPVFGGGGIVPDVNIKPQIFTPAQVRLIDPIFAFVRELVNGRIAGFDSYRVQGGIDFGHDLQASDFPVTDAVYKAFKDYVASQPAYKASAAQLDRNADFIRLQMRYDMTTAAYGTAKATRVLIAGDPQAMKALDVLPRARELAATAMRGRNPQQKSF